MFQFRDKNLNEEINTVAVVKVFQRGDTILREESYIRSIPLIRKGILRVLKEDAEGNRFTLYYIKAGESCVMSLLGAVFQETSKLSAIVEEDAELVLIPVEKANQWLQKYPEWADFFLRLYHRRFEELLNVVNQIAFGNLEVRLHRLLIQKSQLTASKKIYTTHEELAQELATSRVVVSRELKKLEKKGVLELGRNLIELK
ncbi:MAG: Crp/Fnr family transcriptional regulator [Bacteroidia bacterium]|nr:Crp/Fnr family transcriptional regulator [Bacteroidia bacterium]